MYEIDDERPIPLGRAATVTTPAATDRAPAGEAPADETAALPTPVVPQAPAPAPEPEPAPRPTARIKRTRAQAAGPGGRRASSSAPPIAVVEPPAALPPAAATAGAVSDAPHAHAGHPMAGLRGFRVEVEPAFGGRARDLARFLAAYVLVVAFVGGLIAAFLAVVGHAGSGHP